MECVYTKSTSDIAGEKSFLMRGQYYDVESAQTSF